ncbi:MAG: ribonuclease P protein component [bacterium]|nr:ribonuclease P protein component [bacterium]
MPKKHGISHSDHKLAANSHLRRKRGAYFILSYGVLAGGRSKNTQIACVVSKKTAARAVDRNLIKRRCRAAARNLLADIKKPLAFIFYANRNAKGASFAEIKQDVDELMWEAMRAVQSN